MIPGLGRSPRGGHGNPLQDSCLENPEGQWSLVGCRPWGCKELDMTEWLNTQTYFKKSACIAYWKCKQKKALCKPEIKFKYNLLIQTSNRYYYLNIFCGFLLLDFSVSSFKCTNLQISQGQLLMILQSQDPWRSFLWRWNCMFFIAFSWRDL